MPSTIDILNLAMASRFYENPPSLIVRQSSSQNFTSGTPAKVNWQAVNLDTAHMFDLANDTYTILYPGWYRVAAKVHWTGNTGGIRFTQLRQNNVASTTLIANRSPSTGVVTSSIDGLVQCSSGDTIQIWADQNSGTSPLATFSTTGYQSSWTMFWIGR